MVYKKPCHFFGHKGCINGSKCTWKHNPRFKRNEQRFFLTKYRCKCGAEHPRKKDVVKNLNGWVCKNCGVIFADSFDYVFPKRNIEYKKLDLEDWSSSKVFYTKNNMITVLFKGPIVINTLLVTRKGTLIKPIMSENKEEMIAYMNCKKDVYESNSANIIASSSDIPSSI